MDNFFRRLQEVADLPDNGGGNSDDDDDNEPKSKAEELARTRKQLHDVTAKWEALQGECSSLQTEYAAYKAKVQTWKDQMKMARAQDRHTIELLRSEATATRAPPLGDAAPGGSDAVVQPPPSAVEAAYVRGLEEQTAMLKETLREYGNQRDAAVLEADRLRRVHREDLQRLEAAKSSNPTMNNNNKDADNSFDNQPTTSSSSSNNNNQANGNTDQDGEDGGEVVRLRLLVEHSERHAEALRLQLRSAEDRHEQLQEESRKALETVQQELQQLQWALDDSTQAQYIRSLEAEVKMWKAEAQYVQRSAASGAEGSAQSPQNATSEAETARLLEELRGVLDKTKAEVAHYRSENIELQSQNAELQMEASIREESVTHLFKECRVLEDRLRVAREEQELVAMELERREDRIRQLELDRKTASLQMDEVKEMLATSQSLALRLQREQSATGDMLRSLKLEVARREAQNQATSARAAVQAAGGVEVKDTTADSTVTASAASETVTPQAILDLVYSLRRKEFSAVRHKARDVWAQRRILWANPKWRAYIIALGLICLLLFVSAYNVLLSFHEDDTTDVAVGDLLKQCEVKLKEAMIAAAAASSSAVKR